VKTDIEYPPNHKAGMRVPKGGSMCANCKFLNRETMKDCTEPYFIKWNGGRSLIPAPIDEYCSDFYQPGKPVSEDWKNKRVKI
jgi:hypothetical protein